MNVTIYKVTSPSNKVYVGITKNFNKRKNKHNFLARNGEICRFKSAIRKYGSLLIWEVIDIAKDYETAFELEKRYILHFDSYNNGYNMTTGGDGNPGEKRKRSKWSEEAIISQSKLYNSRLEWHKNNPVSYSSAKKISEEFFEKCCSHMPKPIYWTKESILKEAQKHKNVHDWKLASNGSQKAAIRLGSQFYNECKLHMKLRKSATLRKSNKS